ncbi:MAG: hypothetical protein COZ56_16685, partial [Armatimonadetes bacterium CG_4_8_14_3_um_filter_58_9]
MTVGRSAILRHFNLDHDPKSVLGVLSSSFVKFLLRESLELYHKEPSASFRKFFDIRRRIASAS